MKTKKLLVSTLAALLLIPAVAWAKPQVKIGVTAAKVVTVQQDGKGVTKEVPATQVTPGDTVVYTLTVTNAGDSEATHVVINDPIPEGTAYIAGSASGPVAATFSLDGKTFETPAKLTYEVSNAYGTKSKRVASPDQYTHIRWELPKVAAGANEELSFKVKVK